MEVIHSSELAEFFGILSGDGHISRYQISITLGSKELSYAEYVAEKMTLLFAIVPKIIFTKKGHIVVYVGSVALVRYFLEQGLASNKTKAQIKAPEWIFRNEDYMRSFVRGFFDTDGSIYRLRYGSQISFTNRSLPLLEALQRMLRLLEYTVSEISGPRFYITRSGEIRKFFSDIAPANGRHIERFENIMICAGGGAVKRS